MNPSYYLAIQSVDTLTTVILLLILTCITLSISVAILWYRYSQIKYILTVHIVTVNDSIKEIEDMLQ